ncbi:MAG: ATP-binding protein [Gammaproteobacteria bacterium]|nr:ATP-binding protein [Gammaproteobacteria bacterium]
MTQAITEPTMTEFFTWIRHPFADTRQMPKPFIPEADKRILSHARDLLSMGKSFAICGPSGAGKTTLTNHLLSQLDTRDYRPYTVSYGGFNRAGLLRLLAEEMGVDPSGRSCPLLHRIHNQIRQLAEANQPHHPLFVVDDAHLLERESLLDLCALLTLPAHNTVAASLILVGDETFPKLLSLRVMAPVYTRLACIFPQTHLSEQDCTRLIQHRLTAGKAAPDLFEPEAIALMAAHTVGNRRSLMNLATMLLQEAFDRKEHSVSAQLVLSSQFFQQTKH